MAINKVQYGNTTLIDLTDTTATAADVMQGTYFYDRAGVRTEGTATLPVDGDSLGYGLTDGTLPLVGVGKIGQAVI